MPESSVPSESVRGGGDLRGRAALVTGASSGLGRAATWRLLREGMNVTAVDLDDGELAAIDRHARNLPGRLVAFEADVSRESAMQDAVARTLEAFGRLDAVFANAGINGVWAGLDDLSVEEFIHTIQVNLVGTFVTLKACVPAMRPRGGSIVVTSSINGTRIFSNSGATAYSASKAGQVALAKMLALELAPSRIRVNVICPGAIQTNIDQRTERRDLESVGVPVEFPEGEIPLTAGEPGQAEQVADLVRFLVSDASRHITGTEIYIDGGQSLLRG